MALGMPPVNRPGQRTAARAPASPVSRPLHTRTPSSSSLGAFVSDLSGVEREVPRSVAASALRPSSAAAHLLETFVQQQVPQNGLLDAVTQKQAPSNSLMESVQQQASHDSLLRNGAASFWSYMDSASSNGSPDALKAVAAAVSSIPDVPVAVKASLSSLSTSLLSTFSSSGVVPDLSPIRGAAEATLAALHQSNLLPSLPSLRTSLPTSPDLLSTLQASVQSSSLFDGTYTQSQATAIVAAALAAAILTSVTAHVTDTTSTASDADLPTEYDSAAIYHYWSKRPVMLFKRSLETAWLASGFLVGLQLDRLFGEQKKNEKMRAKMLRLAVDRLGPAYIKVAQALSTRVDLLSPAYFEEITLLQDRVAPFPTEQAMEILEAELGGKASQFFSKISPAPVAAASLGQVYRATLKETGEEVAIKVQRPGVLELVALDLVLGRKGIEIAGTLFPDVTRSADILPVLDEWALKLYREMDYRKEAAMMARFAVDLKPLSGILVPKAYPDLVTRRVLCTEWIEGEKLSESHADDVKQLCTTLLNAYLIQLLDTGLLHADPHPGNLIRTPDGRICILDYGLVTEVPEKFRIYILEYMAHLSLRDWHAIGDDFVKLQFLDETSAHPNSVPGLMDSVGVILGLLMGGGGLASLDKVKSKELVDMVGLDPAEFEDAGFMDGFASVITNLSNPSSSSSSDSAADRERVRKIKKLNEQVKFRLPPYFVLILRAFSVIEGIALKVDPHYSIINETFPYLSRRLLTDDNDEVRRALRQMLYGDGKRMDLSRFTTLFDSLQSFTTDGLTVGGSAAEGGDASARSGGGTSTSGGVLDKNTLLALQSVFNPSGSSYIQELLVSELAATLDALTRGAAVALLQRALQSSLTNGTLALLERLGPMRRLLFPFPLPAEVISRLGVVVTLTQDDEVAIRNVQTVWGLLRPQLAESLGQGNLQISLLRSFASTVGELPNDTRSELLAGAGRTSQMVLEQVVQRTAARFAEDVTSVHGQQSAINGAIGGGLVPPQGVGSRSMQAGASAARAEPRRK